LALLDATWCEPLARLSLELPPWAELLPRRVGCWALLLGFCFFFFQRVPDFLF